jgi:hypothetical protein
MQIIIPDNNLPFCVQKYKFEFIKPENFINWSTACAIPSNLSGKRVWNFNISGEISKTFYKHIIKGSFKNVDSFGYTKSFEGFIQGTIIIKGRVFDANKYMTYKNNKKELIKSINSAIEVAGF